MLMLVVVVAAVTTASCPQYAGAIGVVGLRRQPRAPVQLVVG
jgi:hypothetical protein